MTYLMDEIIKPYQIASILLVGFFISILLTYFKRGSLSRTVVHLVLNLMIERMMEFMLRVLVISDSLSIFTKFDKKNHKPDISENDHLIMQLLRKKSSDNLITYVSLLIAFIGEYALYVQTQEVTFLWTMRVTVLLLLFNFINQRVLKYRSKHGLYGTCYSEAKEIVDFILEWHRKNGNSNGKPPKLVFTQEEIDECLKVNGNEEYAG